MQGGYGSKRVRGLAVLWVLPGSCDRYTDGDDSSQGCNATARRQRPTRRPFLQAFYGRATAYHGPITKAALWAYDGLSVLPTVVGATSLRPPPQHSAAGVVAGPGPTLPALSTAGVAQTTVGR